MQTVKVNINIKHVDNFLMYVQSTCSLASTQLTRGHFARKWYVAYWIVNSRSRMTLMDLDNVISAISRHVSNVEVRGTLVVHRFLTWWLVDICGSSAILLAVYLARTTPEPLQCVSDKYHPNGSDQQEDLATIGSVQLRQTLALWTLALRLPGERPLLETNGDILWTQQCFSGVRSKERIFTAWLIAMCSRSCHQNMCMSVSVCLSQSDDV